MRGVIWVVVNSAHEVKYIEQLIDERVRSGADMMYPRRFKQARACLLPGDRVVMHFGGRTRSHPKAQHLVAAGYVKSAPKRLTYSDAGRFPRLWDLSVKAFKWFPRKASEITGYGIIWYDLYPCEAREVLPLRRRYRQPRVTESFIPLYAGDPIYEEVADWWYHVAPLGRDLDDIAPEAI